MPELLYQAFSLVCGQSGEHMWSPGSVLLPCCQRCVGLYVGAVIAALLHLSLRPRLSGRFLEIHGLFLLLMVPFGFHWLPHGPAWRAITGVLFGFGVVTFLWLVPASQWTHRTRGPRAAWGYALGLVLTLALLPVLTESGDRRAAWALAGLAVAGALSLAALVVANVALGLAGLTRFCRRVASPAGP